MMYDYTKLKPSACHNQKCSTAAACFGRCKSIQENNQLIVLDAYHSLECFGCIVIVCMKKSCMIKEEQKRTFEMPGQ